MSGDWIAAIRPLAAARVDARVSKLCVVPWLIVIKM